MGKADLVSEDQRIPKPPAAYLDKAVDYVRAIQATGGTSGTYDDLSRAFNTSNVTSGTFLSRLYSLRSLGFIDVDARAKTYRFTRLGMDVIQPDGPNGEIIAAQEAAKNLEPLRVIWEGYYSQMLPSEEYLANAISKRFNIPDDRKQLWADYFLRAGRFARFIEERPNGLYVNKGLIDKGTSVNNQSPEQKTSEDLTPTNRQRLSEMPPAKRTENAAQAIDELSMLLTRGNKLHRRIGNSYILLYMDADMTPDESTDFQRVLEKLSEAAKALLSMI